MTLASPSLPTLTDDSALALTLAAATAADDRKAGDIAILRVSEVAYLADYFLICSGFSVTQVRAIARSIEEKLAEDFNRLPLRSEGVAEGRWVLLDYGDLIVHIFLPQEREFYDLEAFWGHAERLPYSPPAPVNQSSLNL
ncbi:ribosome silencing factor [Synechococcus elongatus]|uniref:Ribosomal silencing factor RsfS n=1 Tax=Synechococcus elongatus PCC 11801 TaxID=2219813 RepID=A0AAN1QLV9_SYNEL|nr:ribosome silencing factor [Synechococcus elongatus]AZB71681.1 ribosome silencing factor [Synechococcus elongatus PCC 11801]